MSTNSIFPGSSNDREISDDREISFDFKLPKDGKAIDLSTINKYIIEFSNDNATPTPLDYDTRKTFVDYVDYDMPETDSNP